MSGASDKVFVVTGANSGVGLETARGLAQTGTTVVMTARNREKGEAAVADVRASTGNDRVTLQMLDLASLASFNKQTDSRPLGLLDKMMMYSTNCQKSTHRNPILANCSI